MNQTTMVTRDLSILIADDSPAVVAELTALLETIPGTRLVGTAANASQTIQAVLDLDPDVLILDMRMPDGSGLDVLRALLSLGCRTATVMVTNHADAATRGHAFRAGAVAFYDKSRQIPELLADIESRASSRPPGKEATLDLQAADMGAVVSDMESMLRRWIGEDVELSVFVAAEPMRVLADPVQIEGIVMNLVTNAANAMPSGGRIVIRVEPVAAGPGRMGSGGPHVMLTVRDTGTGIDPQAMPHIFHPFFKPQPRGKGTGHELSTVHGVVTQAGGAIEVESGRGDGTEFRVYLPRADQPLTGGHVWQPSS
jgi:K+-sensing histidine kinase KdpD